MREFLADVAKNFSAKHLMVPPTAGTLDTPELTGETLMRKVLDQPIACAVRIGG
jgi:hypothetical protein